MAYSDDQLNAIYEKTDGHCHLCKKKIAWRNYGVVDARGAWEVDHSRARANGGGHHLRNWMPACISCNRGKQAGSTRAIRAANGLRRAPMSKAEKDQLRHGRMTELGIGGGLTGLMIAGPIGAAIGAFIGAAAGSDWDPEGEE